MSSTIYTAIITLIVIYFLCCAIVNILISMMAPRYVPYIDRIGLIFGWPYYLVVCFYDDYKWKKKNRDIYKKLSKPEQGP